MLQKPKAFTYLEGDFIFHNPNTLAPWHSHRSYLREWTHVLRRAPVKDKNGKEQFLRYRAPKHTRHTYASMLLSKGEILYWVSKQLGHTDTRITQKYYVRWMPDESALAGYQTVHDWGRYLPSDLSHVA